MWNDEGCASETGYSLKNHGNSAGSGSYELLCIKRNESQGGKTQVQKNGALNNSYRNKTIKKNANLKDT